MAFGSLFWGAVAGVSSIPVALSLAAVILLTSVALNRLLPLTATEGLNLSPSLHWPTPDIQIVSDDSDQPVFITVEYFIEPATAKEFKKIMHYLRLRRLKDGTLQWQLLHDVANPGRYLECFQASSWIQHLRHHERVAEADKELQAQALTFHINETPPVVTHLLRERTDI
jgi:hypothetical protein